MANLGDIISALFGKPRTLSTMEQKIQALTDIVDLLRIQADELRREHAEHRHRRYADPDYPHRYTTTPPLTNTEEPE